MDRPKRTKSLGLYLPKSQKVFDKVAGGKVNCPRQEIMIGGKRAQSEDKMLPKEETKLGNKR